MAEHLVYTEEEQVRSLPGPCTMKKRVDWKVLILSLVIVYAIAIIGSLFTSSSVNSSWYENIKPEITPPNWIFPVVWNILFFLIAISLYLAWIHSDKNNKKRIALVFGINFILNILWSVLYFGLRNPAVAFIEIIFLWSSILLMIKVTFNINRISSYLLIPYLVWVSFAVVLNWLSAF